MAAMTTLSGSAVAAAPAHRLSSSATFGSSGVQQLCVVRPSAKVARNAVAVRASSNDEEKKPQMLVALVAAGAALALTATPISPAYAGLFGDGPKLDRGASDLGKEGAGNQVGSNSDVRGAAGTPLNEGSNSLVGDNSTTRSASSSGTPLGEGNLAGSGSTLGLGGVAERAKQAVGTEVGPFGLKGAPDVSGSASDAKDAASNVAGAIKAKLPGGN